MNNSLTTKNGENKQEETMIKSKNPNQLFDSYFQGIEDMFTSLFNINRNRYLSKRPDMWKYDTVEEVYNSTYNWHKTDEGMIYTLPVAGCSENDVSVELDGNSVSITAEYVSEGYTNKYSTQFAYDSTLFNEDDIEANVENGLLTIQFPFREETKSERKTRKLM